MTPGCGDDCPCRLPPRTFRGPASIFSTGETYHMIEVDGKAPSRSFIWLGEEAFRHPAIHGTIAS